MNNLVESIAATFEEEEDRWKQTYLNQTLVLYDNKTGVSIKMDVDVDEYDAVTLCLGLTKTEEVYLLERWWGNVGGIIRERQGLVDMYVLHHEKMGCMLLESPTLCPKTIENI